MFDLERWGNACGIAVVVIPYLLVAVIGLPSLVGRPLTERATARAGRWLISLGLILTLVMLGLMLMTDNRHIVVTLGNWVSIHHDHTSVQEHYHFTLKFEFDRLSIPLAILSFALCGTIGGFATKYMHREPGYNRFFALFSVFLAGMVTASLSNTIETLFAGWELVGLSSALLVAFFQERAAPARNGLRVWIVYRVSDAALLLAAVVMHHMTGEGDFDKMLGAEPWPDGCTTLTEMQAFIIGFLLLIAAAGKSALVPFSGWLPRAMEGPTPSSAVFYGALSVHLGAFLLLRCSPLIAVSMWTAVAIVTLGLTTAAYAYLVGTVQTDIKSILSFASLTQVGIIIVEIGIGHWVPFFWYIALTHLLGNAMMRTMQFVRAPSHIRDHHDLENAIGERLPRPPGPMAIAPSGLRTRMYRFALDRGYLDAMLINGFVNPFIAMFRRFGRLEERWMTYLNRNCTIETPESIPAVDSTPKAAPVESHS